MGASVVIAVVVLVLILAAGLTNSVRIYRKEVDPTLSTWVILLVGALLSFATYLSTGKGNLVAGALNGADILSETIVVLSIILFGVRQWRMRSFEKFYFGGLVVVAVFWFLTANAFISNLLVQVILALGYVPTIHTLLKGKANVESFAAWGLVLAASFVSLYPSVTEVRENGDILPLVYAVRSIVLLSTVLVLMWVYRKKPAVETQVATL